MKLLGEVPVGRAAAILAILGGLTGCAAGRSDQDKGRLIEWPKLTIEQALKCDQPLFEMNQAMKGGDLVSGSTKASETAKVCREAAVRVAEFGDLPRAGTTGDVSTEHPCGLGSLATSRAAQQTIALIDGDLRPSVQAGVKAALDDRASGMAACTADMAARAKSVGLAEGQLKKIVRQARLQATGSDKQRTMLDQGKSPAS